MPEAPRWSENSSTIPSGPGGIHPAQTAPRTTIKPRSTRRTGSGPVKMRSSRSRTARVLRNGRSLTRRPVTARMFRADPVAAAMTYARAVSRGCFLDLPLKDPRQGTGRYDLGGLAHCRGQPVAQRFVDPAFALAGEPRVSSGESEQRFNLIRDRQSGLHEVWGSNHQLTHIPGPAIFFTY